MAVKPIIRRGSSGGGGIGQLIGTGVGAATGFLVGGPPGAATGAGIGAGVGGAAGGMIAPGSPQQQLSAPDNGAMQRRLDSQPATPNYSEQLKEAFMASQALSEEERQKAQGPLAQAYLQSLRS